MFERADQLLSKAEQLLRDNPDIPPGEQAVACALLGLADILYESALISPALAKVAGGAPDPDEVIGQAVAGLARSKFLAGLAHDRARRAERRGGHGEGSSPD